MERVFPDSAKLGRVLGVLRIINHYEGKMTLSRLARLSRGDVDFLQPNLEAARMLGLIKMQKENVIITPLGTRLVKNDKNAKEQIAKKLRTYEPFKTADKHLDYGFSVNELEMALRDKNIMWGSDPRKSQIVLKTMLMQWAIFFKLASYNGVSGRWSKVKNHTSPA